MYCCTCEGIGGSYKSLAAFTRESDYEIFSLQLMVLPLLLFQTGYLYSDVELAGARNSEFYPLK